jgi:hypothetical protein
MTKVMVTTGYDEGTKKIEVFDLLDPSNVCQPLIVEDYPLDNVYGASGGLLDNNIALICGGEMNQHPYPILDDCFAFTDNTVEANLKLAQPRFDAASVVLNGTTLWLTGGVILDEEILTNSTEFVETTGTRPGPDLPLEVRGHCLVSLNDTTVLLIGGVLPRTSQTTKSKATFYYSTDHMTWTEGPSLKTGRSDFSCALFKSPQHGYTDTVIVTGGFNDAWHDLASTEFLNLDSNSWISGKYHIILNR